MRAVRRISRRHRLTHHYLLEINQMSTRPKQVEVHAHGPAEHSLCGIAFDAFDSGDLDEREVYAARGRPVTCAMCLQMIEHVYDGFTRNGRARATS